MDEDDGMGAVHDDILLAEDVRNPSFAAPEPYDHQEAERKWTSWKACGG